MGRKGGGEKKNNKCFTVIFTHIHLLPKKGRRKTIDNKWQVERKRQREKGRRRNSVIQRNSKSYVELHSFFSLIQWLLRNKEKIEKDFFAK